MKGKGESSWIIPVILTVVVAVAWWFFWYGPRQQQAQELEREVAGLLDRITQGTAELQRLQSLKVRIAAVPVERAKELWAEVAEILEGEGFAITRVEPGTQGVPGGNIPQAFPGGVPQGLPPGGGLQGPPPGPGGAPGPQEQLPGPAPGGPAPGPSRPSPVVTVSLQLKFEGDYTKLPPALTKVTQAIPASSWTRLELNGQPDGTVRVDAELRIVAVEEGIAR